MDSLKIPKTLKQYSIQRKLEVIKLYHQVGNNACEASRRINIDRRLIAKWVAKEEKLTNYAGQVKVGKRKRIPKECTAKYPELERKLKDWVFEVFIDKMLPLNIKDIRCQALIFIAEENNTDKYEQFKVSEHWVRKFMHRNSLGFRGSLKPKDKENRKPQREDQINDQISDEVFEYIDILGESSENFIEDESNQLTDRFIRVPIDEDFEEHN